MKRKLLRFMASTGLIVMLSACAKLDNLSGPIRVTLLKPSATHCGYDVGDATITTLTSLKKMQGLIGKVGYFTGREFSVAELNGGAFEDVDVHFSMLGGKYTPLDYGSLYAASLYYYLETGYLLFKGLGVDMASEVPDMGSSKILLEAKFKDDDGEAVVDNAAYLYSAGQNFFLSYPHGDFITGLPFGMNLGVMVHEYTHFVMNHLVRRKLGSPDNQRARDTLNALDEGMADYFGFLAAQDPGYFLCTEENLNRDLGVITSKVVQTGMTETCRGSDAPAASACLRIPGSKYFSEHALGATFAAENYRRGQQVGHMEHAKTLINLMRRIGRGECGSASSISFSSITGCHTGGSYTETNLRSLN